MCLPKFLLLASGHVPRHNTSYIVQLFSWPAGSIKVSAKSGAMRVRLSRCASFIIYLYYFLEPEQSFIHIYLGRLFHKGVTVVGNSCCWKT